MIITMAGNSVGHRYDLSQVRLFLEVFVDNRNCKGCGKKCITVYCGECAKHAMCPHDNPIDGDCIYCIDDLAFDANRERGK